MTYPRFSAGRGYSKVLIVSLLFAFVSGQASLGGLGTGLLQPGNHLHNGGLVYPNPDGSGPQANNLAAAIYGVAVPPGFSQFSASENYFGANPYTGTSGGTNPLDLLVGTGLHGGSASDGPAFGSQDFSAGGSNL